MSDKECLLLVNEFDIPTIAKLDQIYQTYKLWQVAEAEQPQFLQAISSHCRAAATGSWSCNSAVYSLPELKIISCFGVGVDGIDFEQTQRLGIKVTNTPDVLNDAVADIAMALILATSRNLIKADNFLRSGHWLKGQFPMGRSLADKTLGIIGLGRIGEAIVHRALPFKMNIAYHNRSAKSVPHRYCASLVELAAISDILLCVLPGGKFTEGIVDAEIFQALGSDGIFVNVGRGSSVDETALIAALTNHTIAAAGLDVFAEEPVVPESLLQLDNVVLFPHIGSGTTETRLAMGQLVIDNLQAYFSDTPLITQVQI